MNKTIYVKESAETFNQLLQTKIPNLQTNDILPPKYLNSIGIKTPDNVCVWIDNSMTKGVSIRFDEDRNKIK